MVVEAQIITAANNATEAAASSENQNAVVEEESQIPPSVPRSPSSLLSNNNAMMVPSSSSASFLHRKYPPPQVSLHHYQKFDRIYIGCDAERWLTVVPSQSTINGSDGLLLTNHNGAILCSFSSWDIIILVVHAC